MENLGVVNPKLSIQGSGIISVVLQVIMFLVVGFIMFQILKLYFKNIELKKNPEKNQTEIEENFAKIEKIKKISLKIGGIVFGVIILLMIILSNFIEF